MEHLPKNRGLIREPRPRPRPYPFSNIARQAAAPVRRPGIPRYSFGHSVASSFIERCIASPKPGCTAVPSKVVRSALRALILSRARRRRRQISVQLQPTPVLLSTRRRVTRIPLAKVDGSFEQSRQRERSLRVLWTMDSEKMQRVKLPMLIADLRALNQRLNLDLEHR